MIRKTAILLALLGWGCSANTPAASSDLCERAAAHVSTCFEGADVQTSGCDEARAAAALDQTCAELRESGDKADCSVFTWWECYGGGGSSDASGGKLQISVDECLNDFTGSCAGVSAVACAAVTVETASGDVVAEGFTSGHGGFAVEDLEAGGEYVVRVKRRDGTVPDATFGDYVEEIAPAEAHVTIDGDTTRLDLRLVHGERGEVYSCASLEVRSKVMADGEQVDPDEQEWDWIAVFEGADGPIGDPSRSYRAYDSEDDFSSFRELDLRPGDYTVAYHRVSVPDYARLPNRNQELLDTYEVYGAEPQVVSVTIGEGDIGTEVASDVFVLEDPTPGE